MHCERKLIRGKMREMNPLILRNKCKKALKKWWLARHSSQYFDFRFHYISLRNIKFYCDLIGISILVKYFSILNFLITSLGNYPKIKHTMCAKCVIFFLQNKYQTKILYSSNGYIWLLECGYKNQGGHCYDKRKSN